MRHLWSWLFAISIAVAVLPYPIALVLDAVSGIEGWEMAEIDDEMLALASESTDRTEFLANFGFTTDDAISEQLSLIGRTGPFTQRGEQTRFVFVPADHIHQSPFGPLIVFDRSADEEFLQARSLRNISIVVSGGGLAAVLLSGLGLWWSRRRRPAAQGDAVDGEVRR